MGRAHNVILDRGGNLLCIICLYLFFPVFFFSFFNSFHSCLSVSVQEESDTCSLTSTFKNCSISFSSLSILMAPVPDPNSVGGGGAKRDEATTKVKAPKKKEEDLVLSVSHSI